MTKVLRLATSNAHKLREFQEILEPLGFRVLGTADVPGYHVEETGETFVANALAKAQALCALLGAPAVADDSGLCVDALGGAPGVRSARYAGVDSEHRDEANRAHLLAQLRSCPPSERAARFVCALALVTPGHQPLTVEGRLEGHIASEPRGQGGFGYDPIFVPQGEARTLAELSPAEKHRISHRGAALAQLVRRLEADGRGTTL